MKTMRFFYLAALVPLVGCRSNTHSSGPTVATLDAYERIAFSRYIANKMGHSDSPSEYVITERDLNGDKVVAISPKHFTDEDLQGFGGKKSGGYSVEVYVDRVSKKIVKITVAC